MKLHEENRSHEQLVEHYEIEKELADKLRHSSKEDRKQLYTHVYNELFKRVPHHPQLTKKVKSDKYKDAVKSNMSLLRRYLLPESAFLEIGSGDCLLSLEVAKIVKDVYAIDVSDIITQDLDIPDNFNLIISDGCSIDLPDNSIDIAFSNQLMEHLHPDDAIEQLKNIYSVLKPGGKYLCITPNRIFGPHDISKYFDDVATGFHLKEYTISELAGIFGEIGFSSVKRFINIRGFVIELPLFPATNVEKVLVRQPSRVRGSLVSKLRLKYVFGGENIKLIATKP